ncbi:DUF192 domain-containing protein [Aquabacter spiritensis]|uniref:DUF192 domain-containing protein n=1 Tax=Aquabacter spiritensis TaxID=933073 RepID=A0A4R3LWT6_9HYPH|nr:DUF192 domain-containing protein [Aquabacter spiritensis]TCT04616.1 hypothetical protein EDC64_10646 [Aquabacter spiritensis]
MTRTAAPVSHWAGRACAFALLALFTALAAPAAAQPNEAQPSLPHEALEIATRSGVVVLEVEVARTPKQREIGLMFRTLMPERQGMLFDFGVDQTVYMWMKNTYIPLDMLFVRADGTIVRIEAMTTPKSERTISSGEPVRGVLEIAGGGAKRLGIAPGDRMSTTLFGK